MTANKKINDCTEAPKKNTFFFAGKINIINKHEAGIKCKNKWQSRSACNNVVFHFLVLATLAQFTRVTHRD